MPPNDHSHETTIRVKAKRTWGEAGRTTATNRRDQGKHVDITCPNMKKLDERTRKGTSSFGTDGNFDSLLGSQHEGLCLFHVEVCLKSTNSTRPTFPINPVVRARPLVSPRNSVDILMECSSDGDTVDDEVQVQVKLRGLV